MHELIRDITLCILFAWVLGLLSPFFPATAHLGLPYRRIFHWSIRHGLGQVAGIDQHHLRAGPDFHALYDRTGDRPEEDRPPGPGDPVRDRRETGRRLRAWDPVFRGHRAFDV